MKQIFQNPFTSFAITVIIVSVMSYYYYLNGEYNLIIIFLVMLLLLSLMQFIENTEFFKKYNYLKTRINLCFISIFLPCFVLLRNKEHNLYTIDFNFDLSISSAKFYVFLGLIAFNLILFTRPSHLKKMEAADTKF